MKGFLRKHEQIIYRALCVLILIPALIPAVSGRAMEGRNTALWLARIGEIKTGLMQGNLPWFPSAELTVAHSSGAMAFDHALWLLVPAALEALGMGERLVWCLFMGLVQLGTLGAAFYMAKAFFREKAAVLASALFYMSCPYRLYVCYDRVDMGAALVWMLCPVFIGGLVRLCREGIKNPAGWCGASLAYGGIWYADARLAVLLGAVSLCCILIGMLRIWCFLPLAAGGILGLPAAIYLLRYLIKGGMQVWNLPTGSIMESGYAPGQYLTAGAYQPDLPGLGLLLMGALLLLAWLCFSGDGGRLPEYVSKVLAVAGILTVCSLKYIPWDWLQRLGLPFLRYIGMLESAGVFWGCANMLLCIPAAWAVAKLCKKLCRERK